MARYSYDGIDSLADSLKKLENPDDAFQSVIKAIGEIVKDKIVEVGKSKLGFAKFLDSIWLKNPKKDSGGWSSIITFRGVQHEKNARNAEIAFINEYGLESHGNPSSGYFEEALNKSEAEALAAGQQAFDYWLATNGF